jgi:hypothetical protein
MKFGMYIMAPEPGVLHNPSHQSVWLDVYFPLWLLGNGSVNTFRSNEYTKQQNNCRTRRFLCGPCGIKGESVGVTVYPAIVACQRLGKDVPAATNNCWRRRFLCGPYRIRKVSDYFFPELLVIV